MRSKISLFDKTVLKKNLLRFAPAWGLYSLYLLMVLVPQIESGKPGEFVDNIVATLDSMSVVNMFYALITAQLLFGDLYNSRMCNALHALPLRRETLFFTNLLSGMLFSLVPNAVMTGLCMALVFKGWAVYLLWLAVMILQYLFFFGLATLCAHITGNRFAMVLVYGLVNGFALIVFWLLDSLYIPNLYGVVFEGEIVSFLMPVAMMVGSEWYISVKTEELKLVGGGNNWELKVSDFSWEFAEGWGYLAICAAVGVGLLALALHCYRKRDLEKAGDFMTIRGLGPVFLVLFSLCTGAFCEILFMEAYFIFLGLAIGFFTGLMLLKRTVRVFRWKTIGGFALFLAAFILSGWLTVLDPLGITRYVPDPEKVAHVSINTDTAYYPREDGTVWDDIRQIEEIQTIHRHAIENRNERYQYDGDQLVRITLIYELKNGRTVTRAYVISTESQAGRTLRTYLSSPEYVLGWVWTGESQVPQVKLRDPETVITDPNAIDSLLDAIIADCQAGTLPQSWQYSGAYEKVSTLTLLTYNAEGDSYWRAIHYTEAAKNLTQWLKERGLESEKWK